MTAMIERVAKAIRDAELTHSGIGEPWINHTARKAIEAMREPSEEMLDAYWHQTGESKEMRLRTHAYMKRYFAAMIDAAATAGSAA